MYGPEQELKTYGRINWEGIYSFAIFVNAPTFFFQNSRCGKPTLSVRRGNEMRHNTTMVKVFHMYAKLKVKVISGLSLKKRLFQDRLQTSRGARQFYLSLFFF